MAQVCKITNASFGGSTTVDLMADPNNFANLSVNLGQAERDRRVITIQAAIFGSTHDALWTNVNKLLRLLLSEAITFRMLGQGRRVTFEWQPDGGSYPVTYHVLGGQVKAWPDLSDVRHLLKHWIEPVEIELICEPYGVGAETALLTSTTLYSHNASITHNYLHHTGGTVFSVNMMAVVERSLWQSDKLTTSPTNRTPAGSDKLYLSLIHI